MFKRGWLEEELQEGVEDGKLLQKVEEIQQRCDETYEAKLKIYSHLLISSIKALGMNKYERKMIALCHTGDNLFFAPHIKHSSHDDPINSEYPSLSDKH